MVSFGKKLLALAVLIAAVTFTAAAYDGRVTGCTEIGSMSRKDFQKMVGTDSFDAEIYNALVEGVSGSGCSVERFFLIDSSRIDDEDSEFLDDLEAYLRQNYRVKNGSTFGIMVLRGDTDGWYVVSNFSNKDCVHVVYYFNIE